MSKAENENAREEKGLDALVAAAFKEEPSEVGSDEIERYRSVLTSAERNALDAAGANLIDLLFTGGARKSKATESGALSTAMNRGDDGVTLTDRACDEMERKMREASELRKPSGGNRKIREHDVVRVRIDTQVEGYALLAGTVGTVVSVYRDGEAFAVEFPQLERGSAVITLYRDQVEPVEGTDE